MCPQGRSHLLGVHSRLCTSTSDLFCTSTDPPCEAIMPSSSGPRSFLVRTAPSPTLISLPGSLLSFFLVLVTAGYSCLAVCPEGCPRPLPSIHPCWKNALVRVHSRQVQSLLPQQVPLPGYTELSLRAGAKAVAGSPPAGQLRLRMPPSGSLQLQGPLQLRRGPRCATPSLFPRSLRRRSVCPRARESHSLA